MSGWMNATVLCTGTSAVASTAGGGPVALGATVGGRAGGTEVAMDRLALLAAVLGELGVAGMVRRIGGYPVLYVTDPPAPWAVSVGAAHFWRGDPAEIIGP